MLFNPISTYKEELTNIFINALIDDKDSIYNKSTRLEVIEGILSNNIEFEVDKEDVIFEKFQDQEKHVIFKNNKKNSEAIYAIKILLKEY
jgi:Na+-translocating ferredoxin:NAD+ oxidoreductase RnfG subunit